MTYGDKIKIWQEDKNTGKFAEVMEVNVNNVKEWLALFEREWPGELFLQSIVRPVTYMGTKYKRVG